MVYCAGTTPCAGELRAEGWEVLQEMGTLNRFGGPSVGSNSSASVSTQPGLQARGWDFSPPNFVVAEPEYCSLPNDCTVLRRYSLNAMLAVSHSIPAHFAAFSAAWTGEDCELQLFSSNGQLVQAFSAVPFQAGVAPTVTTRSLDAAAGGTITFAAGRNGKCIVSYVLVHQDATPPALPASPPPSPLPPSSPPPTLPPLLPMSPAMPDTLHYLSSSDFILVSGCGGNGRTNPAAPLIFRLGDCYSAVIEHQVSGWLAGAHIGWLPDGATNAPATDTLILLLNGVQQGDTMYNEPLNEQQDQSVSFDALNSPTIQLISNSSSNDYWLHLQITHVVLVFIAPSPTFPPLAPAMPFSTPPATPPLGQPPSTLPRSPSASSDNHSVIISASASCATTEECSLASALLRAEAFGNETNVTIKLGSGSYNLTLDTQSSWPFDFGLMRASVTIETQEEHAILDAGYKFPFFLLTMPSNRLVLRNIILRGGSATSAPADGGSVLVAAGRLFVDSCGFEGNHADGWGGSIALIDGVVEARDSWFANNSAIEGGAIAIGVLPSATCGSGNRFRDNDASSSVVGAFEDCSFNSNSALSGAAAWLSAGETAFRRCRFTQGDALEEGGALQVVGSSTFTVQQCVCFNNRASGHGSCISFDSVGAARPPLWNNTFEGNIGDSTVFAAKAMDWNCTGEQFAPLIGFFPGSWVGCPFKCGLNQRLQGGTFSASVLAQGSDTECEFCPAGRFTDSTVAQECLPCPVHHYCTGETGSGRTPCPAGMAI